ncbi:hypothetical protein L596_019542 [Steinernema carpocapsae]|uniref:phosphatidylinositol-3,4,5-trisphosphate 3-phosphatase n=1 Tax=Steinernema carpocapsae TaxID=34508 RepID=A0A4U5MQT7_STECR|nr:hypothetical protein L596_019542 [Steinernema carpocapsae]
MIISFQTRQKTVKPESSGETRSRGSKSRQRVMFVLTCFVQDSRPAGMSAKERHAKVMEELYETLSPSSSYKALENTIYLFRNMTSMNRRRLRHLDLSFITPRIIAMAFPTTGIEILWRNNLKKVEKLLMDYVGDPKNYRFFNLKGGIPNAANYPTNSVFYDMVDHEPPRFEYIDSFVVEAKSYLKEHPEGVIVVHCKAGKGRTGVMICALLNALKSFPNPRHTLDFYGINRTIDNKGVTIPSQRRYVYYHAALDGRSYKRHAVQLVGIYFEGLPEKREGDFKLEVHANHVKVFSGRTQVTERTWKVDVLDANSQAIPDVDYDPHKNREENRFSSGVVSQKCYGWTIPNDSPVFIEGDIRIGLRNKDRLGEIWFNTMFCCDSEHYVHGDMKYENLLENIGFPDPKEVPLSADISLNGDVNFAWLEEKNQEKFNDYQKTLILGARSSYRNHCHNSKDILQVSLSQEAPQNPPTFHERPTEAHIPFVLQLKGREQVQAYEAQEIDYALKKRTLPGTFKAYIVTKCVNINDNYQRQAAEMYLSKLRIAQNELRRARYERGSVNPVFRPVQDPADHHRLIDDFNDLSNGCCQNLKEEAFSEADWTNAISHIRNLEFSFRSVP